MKDLIAIIFRSRIAECHTAVSVLVNTGTVVCDAVAALRPECASIWVVLKLLRL